jgi:hypothetical protein
MSQNVTSDGLRSSLEAQANFVRQRLAAGIDALRERKRVLLDPAEEIRRHPATAMVAGAGMALLLGGGAALAGYHLATRSQRRRQARWNAWVLLATRPERAVSRQRSFIVELLEKGAAAALGAVIASTAKQYVAKALPPEGRR